VARYVVDGLTLPIAVGNHPAVDLCNTETDWTGLTPHEYLVSYPHFVVWSREVGLLDGDAAAESLAASSRRGSSVDADAILARALDFRTAVHRVLTGPATTSDWHTIDGELTANVPALHLGPAAATGRSAATDVAAGHSAAAIGAWSLTAEPLGAPLAAVVWAAAGLLTTARPGDVRACPGAGCGWMFLDPAGRRRWCSMAWCGNRSKVRRHAQRQRRSETQPPR
jgi:predicted RNA-binding Zn ribbon-like protein